MKSLKGRSIAIIFAVTAVCLMIMAFVTYHISSGKVQELSVKEYQTSTANTTNMLKTWLTEQEKLVATQTMTLEINQNFDQDALAAYLTGIVNDYNADGYIYDLYFTSEDNIMASGSGYVPDGSIDFTQRGWYLAALETDDVCYSTPYRDTDSGKLVITLSQKVLKDGNVEGVMAADIFVDTLIELVGEQAVPKDSYSFLVDSANGVVTHPDTEGFAYVEDEPISLESCAYESYKQLAEAIAAEKEVVSFKDYDGVERTFYLHKIDGCDWYVITAISNRVIAAQTSSLRNVYLIILLVSMILVSVVVTLLADTITRPIVKLTKQIQTGTASGENLKHPTTEISQLYQEFNQLMGNLQGLLAICAQAEGNLEEFGGSIENITGAITLGARNVDKQMHRIVETLNVETEDLRQKQTNLQTFDDSIVTFNDNFEEMEQSLDDMIGNLGQSVACAKRLELASNTSSSHVKDISEDISNLESMSNNITQIVSTIMEISSQTNLLALNASIEAARAGEAGRGFAVVADEIRVLSNSTAQATENISEQITQIQGLITNVVSVLNDSTRDFTANAEESGEVLHLLTNMNESVSRAGQMNQNLKGSLQTFVENKDMIVAMFQSIQENIVTCLDASIEAQESAKMQSETSEQLMSESGRLSELATDFRETTSHFKRV